jgi:hypothetical protein
MTDFWTIEPFLVLTFRIASSLTVCSNQSMSNQEHQSVILVRLYSNQGMHSFQWDGPSTGRQTDISCMEKNADGSIRRNNEPGSIETDGRDSQ